MKKFWSFQARSDGVGELYLYGEIADASWLGDEITPAQFARELDALGELRELYVNIHSPGGDAFAGIAIYSILQRCPAKKIVRIDGLAASAASLIAMAGDVIQMPKGATMMIHNAWAHASGEAADLRMAHGRGDGCSARDDGRGNLDERRGGVRGRICRRTGGRRAGGRLCRMG